MAVTSPARVEAMRIKLIEVFGARPAFTISLCLFGVQRALEMFEDRPKVAEVRLTPRQMSRDFKELFARSSEVLGERHARTFLELLVGEHAHGQGWDA